MDKIKIGGIEYTLGTINNFHAPDGTRLNGQIIYEEKTINLDSSLDKDINRIVFLHELLHGIIEHAGGKHSERKIEMLSRGLYQVIKENEEIMKSFLWDSK